MSVNAYESAKQQIKNAVKYLTNIGPYELEHILYPNRVIEVSIPVKMDDGTVETFVWRRSQHNNSRWPYKWWIRFHPDVTRDEVVALSMWMTIKTAVVNLPLWWGKWGVVVNPKLLSENELERLSRWFVRRMYKYLWPDYDVPAPDVNTNAQIMAWMMDEYSKIVWKYTPGAFTGKPLSCGGSKWRFIATSLWWLYVLEKYFEIIWEKIKWKTVAIQWAGNAGLNFAKLIEKKGAKLVAISDSKWGIFDPNGLNIQKIEKLKKDKLSVIKYDKWQVLANLEILELNVDILVLAALENQVTLHNANKIQAQYIVELANGPITPDAEEILISNKKKVLPDILANAWWVTVSYFEQVQNNINYYWEEQEIFEKLSKIMKNATEDIVKLAKDMNIDLRKASYVIALKRLFDTMRDRGEI